jgi:KGK domain
LGKLLITRCELGIKSKEKIVEIVELGADDVVAVYNADSAFAGQLIIKFSDLKQKAKGCLQSPLSYWVNSDIPCKVLQTKGGGWIEGKVRTRVVIDFIPDVIK